MLTVVQLPDVFAHVCPPDAGVTLDVHVVPQSQQHLWTNAVRATPTGGAGPALGRTYLLNLSCQLSGWSQNQGLGLSHLQTGSRSGRVQGTHEEPTRTGSHCPYLDVQTLQHRHAERGCLSCSRLRPVQMRQRRSGGRAEDMSRGQRCSAVVLLGNDVPAFDDLLDGSLLDG